MLKELQIQKASLKDFINFPFELYKGSPYYVGELKVDTKHTLTTDPFWQHARRELFVAKRGAKTVGRIAAIVNEDHNNYWKDETGFFGFFECENNKQTAQALVNAAANWLKGQGLKTIRGPLNPSSNHTCGVLINKFNAMPSIMMPYNPPYYDDILQNAGLKKVKDLLAFERTDKDDFSPRMHKIMARILKNPAIKIRQIDLKHFNDEVEIVRKIYNASWANNWGFVPITEAEIQNVAKQLKLIVRPEITCVIEYNGKPAGFAISIPNMNHTLKILNGRLNPLKIIPALLKWKQTNDCRMIMLGVHPDYRGHGIELLLVRSVVVKGVNKGWHKAELSWVLEDNQGIISVMEEAGCYKTKTYRIYEKPL
ncbi:MAG: GNAT family N-acetyltransferase [Elusimicrobiota bacterium]|jgi:GNAT superfamily N-acetyltransferase|nr:GNAT family N-acetyltransferase [Elusimicrobiota bacterium]